MKRNALIAVALLGLAVHGCGPAFVAATGTAVMAANDRRTTSTIYQDESVERHIGREIGGRFGSLTHVNVTPYNRVVLLTGEVPDERTRAEVEGIVRNIANVRGVINEIRIAPPSSLAARANDSLITSRVKARFIEANKFNPLHVKVVTEAGIVYLLGIVTEQEANEAVELARTTGGVVKVVKVFQSCQPTEEICKPAGPAPSGA